MMTGRGVRVAFALTRVRSLESEFRLFGVEARSVLLHYTKTYLSCSSSCIPQHASHAGRCEYGKPFDDNGVWPDSQAGV